MKREAGGGFLRQNEVPYSHLNQAKPYIPNFFWQACELLQFTSFLLKKKVAGFAGFLF